MTLGIVYDMIRIADAYISGIRDDSEKYTALSTLLYTFDSIFESINEHTLAQFFDGTLDNLTLKPEYLSGDQPTFPADFTGGFKRSLLAISGLLTKEQSEFTRLLGTQQSSAANNFALLAATVAKSKALQDIISDYPTYRKNLLLAEGSRNATGIVFGADHLSEETLRSYLSQFSGLNIGTLQVRNDFQKDGFYDVQVTIDERLFSFTLREPGNILTNLMFTDETGKVNEDFKQAVIVLSDREKIAKERLASARTAEEREQYDFRNYFRTTFFGSAVKTPVENHSTDQTANHPEMSPDMQLTVQHELIEKDFHNLATFMPIAIKNIYAKIENGVYDIDLFGIQFAVRAKESSYLLEFHSKYAFSSDEHTFKNMAFKVLKDDTNGYLFS